MKPLETSLIRYLTVSNWRYQVEEISEQVDQSIQLHSRLWALYRRSLKSICETIKPSAYKTTPLSPEEEKMLAFYREFFAVMDLPHEFYRETVNQVFRGNQWAIGKVDYNWEEVDFSVMTTPLMTIEWGRDDICGIGQTEAAQHLTNPSHSLHIVLPDAGHYGTFAGKDFRVIVLPAFDGFYKSLEERREDGKKVYPQLQLVA